MTTSKQDLCSQPSCSCCPRQHLVKRELGGITRRGFLGGLGGIALGGLRAYGHGLCHAGQDTEKILDDTEPTLWELAQTVTRKQTLPLHPQITACFPAATEQPAVDLCTRKMRVSLWGPPDRLTLTLGKNDVWDRRRAFEKHPFTLGQIWAGAFAECNEGEPKNQAVQPAGYDAHYLHPHGGYRDPFLASRAYNRRFPAPKPVGQAVLLAPDFAGRHAPVAEIRYDDNTAHLTLHQDAAELKVTMMTMMTRNVIAFRVRSQGLKHEPSLRLYRRQDVSDAYWIQYADYDYAADAAWNGLVEPPTSAADGRFFWIRQRFPQEKTFPDGFEYVLVGLAPGDTPVIETVANETRLGTPVDDSALSKFFGGVTYAAENNAPGTAWELCVEIPAQVLKPVWDIWDYGGDVEYLRERVYPALRDLADFYAAYVSKGRDGRYHVIPSVSAEHWGLTYRFARNRDSAAALGMIRWTLQRAAEAAELLVCDAERQKLWENIAQNIAQYPTYSSEAGPVFTDVADVNPIGVQYNFFGGVTPTLLADQIHLDSSPTDKEMMTRTALTIGGWKNRDVFHLLGVYPEMRKGVPASMFFDAKPDEPIDTAGKLLAAVAEEPERLLNSRSGRIHLFPCVPPDATVAFRDFQARGGFLVSAAMKDGCVSFVEITARRTVCCRVMNPWPGRDVTIVETERGDVIKHEMDSQNGECLVFNVARGTTYRVSLGN